MYRCAIEGDEKAITCVKYAARYLGQAVGDLITILNPQKIIIGGPLVRIDPLLVEFTKSATSGWAMAQPMSQASIEAGKLDEFSGALGAACMVLMHKLPLTSRPETT